MVEKDGEYCVDRGRERERGGGRIGRRVCGLVGWSETPTYSSTNSEPDIDKNVALLSPATALARRVLPVPGGPTNKAPCTGNPEDTCC